MDEISGENVHKLQDVLEKLEYFRNISKAGIESLSDQQYIDLQSEINDYFSAWGYWIGNFNQDQKFYRVTVNKRITGRNEQYLDKISQLTGPPKRFLKTIGRCNSLEVPIFYASNSLKAAIMEAVPEEGDVLTMTIWKLKPDQKMNCCQIFHPDVTPYDPTYPTIYDHFIKGESTGDVLLDRVRTENIKFLTEEFVKTVEGKDPRNYIFSSLFSEKIFVGNTKREANHIDSVWYPSTKIRNGQKNLAMADSMVHQKLDLLEIAFTMVTRIWETPEVPYRKIDFEIEKITTTKDFEIAADKFAP
ncbi:RES domain-containing protein [Dyadobacter sp. CY312]|uniref:RES domain-containing protein n=1 Tax=Dyadobacter sp. CY312 TaxID=2907303 RepID=UPI001F2F5783|nr:RES domain-containing protein [Dyadobacter sp. CY312]MCE7042475.1 RES domain-containing protein [Dyadobacter sp. CY312]